MEIQRLGDHQPANTFLLFPKLVMELRLMIWEHTWPEPRVIEGITIEDEDSEEFVEITNFRIAGHLSGLLKQDFGTRLLEGDHVENCPAPMALQICHESRKHTLSQYYIVQSMAGQFWANPYRDILWLSMDLTDERECIKDLQLHHERELETFTTVLVEENEWVDNTPAQYASEYLSLFSGLKTILIVWGGFDDATDELMDVDTQDLQKRADNVRAQHSELLEGHKCTAKSILFMDREGKFY